MSKKLILSLALAMVLVSGALLSAQAECGSGCLPHISLPSCMSCSKDVDQQPARDRDCAGNLITPDVMGSPGF
ncbi:MAG: hypothetical protein WAN11_10380 [Syntrophobacteraceae bacterium]